MKSQLTYHPLLVLSLLILLVQGMLCLLLLPLVTVLMQVFLVVITLLVQAALLYMYYLKYEAKLSQLYQSGEEGSTKAAPIGLLRGFLFIDMNGSTAVAEQLQHQRYSALLCDCYRLLRQVLTAQPGYQIYQYVGDEAIVYWDYDCDVCAPGALQIIEKYNALLQQERTYFLQQYELLPSFKYAIHGGEVTQVNLNAPGGGLAYHGDVLNTCSRLLTLCHLHATDLIVSAGYHNKLRLPERAALSRIDNALLQGKSRSLTVYKRNTNPSVSRHQNQKHFLYLKND